MLPGAVQSAPAGQKGFDVNFPVTAAQAQAFRDAGFTFALRYVGREEMHSIDLTTAEAEILLSHGFALMPVQHVEVETGGWMPTADLGTLYGGNAAKFAQQIGFPPGVNVWVDLEGVSMHATAEDVIAYCSNWYAAVAGAQYVPGLYVGNQPGLPGRQLSALSFQHYWKAYDSAQESEPRPRGFQMQQSVGGVRIVRGLDYYVDTTYVDAMGGQVLWLKS